MLTRRLDNGKVIASESVGTFVAQVATMGNLTVTGTQIVSNVFMTNVSMTNVIVTGNLTATTLSVQNSNVSYGIESYQRSVTPIAVPLTVLGNVVTVSDSPFGVSVGGSLAFPNVAGSYVSVPALTGLDWAGTDFTIETWIRANTNSVYAMGVMNAIAGVHGWSIGLSNSKMYLRYWANPSPLTGNVAGDVTLTGNTTVTKNAWTHLALTGTGARSGNVYLFVNGVQQTLTGTGTQGTYATKANAAALGYTFVLDQLNNQTWPLEIGSVRVLSGNAAYTSPFTPSNVLPMYATLPTITSWLLTVPPKTPGITFASPGNVSIVGPTSVNGALTATSANVQTLVTQYFNDAVYAKSFGAVGDGVTDDTAAINAALSTGKNVFLGSGTFLISATLTMPAVRGQQVIGSGMSQTTIQTISGSAFNVLTMIGCSQTTVTDLAINMVSPTGGYAFYVTNFGGVTIQHINLANTYNGLYATIFDGLTLYDVTGYVRGSYAINCLGNSQNNSFGIRCINCLFNCLLVANGALFDGIDTITLHDFTILGSASYGIWFPGNVGGASAFLYAFNINIDQYLGTAIVADSVDRMFIDASYFHGTNANVCPATVTVGNLCTSVSIVNSSLWGTYNAVVISGNSVNISDNSIYNDGYGYAPAGDGIYVANTANFVTITSNNVRRYAGYAVNVQPGATKVSVSGNTLDSNTLGGVNNSNSVATTIANAGDTSSVVKTNLNVQGNLTTSTVIPTSSTLTIAGNVAITGNVAISGTSSTVSGLGIITASQIVTLSTPTTQAYAANVTQKNESGAVANLAFLTSNVIIANVGLVPSMYFSGGTASCANVPSLGYAYPWNSNAATFEALVYFPTTSGSTYVIGSYATNGSIHAQSINVSGSKLAFRYWDSGKVSGQDTTFIGNTILTSNAWHHLAVCASGTAANVGNIWMFVDGVQQSMAYGNGMSLGVSTTKGTPSTFGYPFTIGGYNGTTAFYTSGARILIGNSAYADGGGTFVPPTTLGYGPLAANTAVLAGLSVIANSVVYGNLVSAGPVVFTGSMSALGNTLVSNSMTVTGNVTISNSMTVTGNIVVGGDISVPILGNLAALTKLNAPLHPIRSLVGQYTLAANNTYSTHNNLAYPGGNVVVQSSSCSGAGNAPMYLFDLNSTTIFDSNTYYNTSNGMPLANSANTTYVNNLGSNAVVQGEWIQIAFPSNILTVGVSLGPRWPFVGRAPAQFYFLGSQNFGTSFAQVHYANLASTPFGLNGFPQTYTITTPGVYNTFRVVCSQTNQAIAVDCSNFDMTEVAIKGFAVP